MPEGEGLAQSAVTPVPCSICFQGKLGPCLAGKLPPGRQHCMQLTSPVRCTTTNGFWMHSQPRALGMCNISQVLPNRLAQAAVRVNRLVVADPALPCLANLLTTGTTTDITNSSASCETVSHDQHCCSGHRKHLCSLTCWMPGLC